MNEQHVLGGGHSQINGRGNESASGSVVAYDTTIMISVLCGQVVDGLIGEETT